MPVKSGSASSNDARPESIHQKMSASGQCSLSQPQHRQGLHNVAERAGFENQYLQSKKTECRMQKSTAARTLCFCLFLLSSVGESFREAFGQSGGEDFLWAAAMS